MNNNDEKELHRLCEMLREVDRDLAADSPLREAVTKAALGLSVAFIHGFRPKIEDMFSGIGRPLNEAQRNHLLSFGIDPGEPIKYVEAYRWNDAKREVREVQGRTRH